jgi:HAD superfamily hydrolase (TIGR01450 family)
MGFSRKSTMFDALILDLDGVIFRGDNVIPGTQEAFRLLSSHPIQFTFVSNNINRPREESLRKLAELLPNSEYTLFDPIDVLKRFYLEKSPNVEQRFLIMGSSSLKDRLAGLGVKLVDNDSVLDASAVLVSSVINLDVDMVTSAAIAIRNGAIFFASGRETSFFWNDKLRPGAGAAVAAVEAASNSRAIVLGKPSSQIFRIASESFNNVSNIIVIGDDIAADIRGAKNAGLKSVLVLTGVTSPSQVKGSRIKPDFVADNLASFLLGNVGQST